jgi:hypothetical protein
LLIIIAVFGCSVANAQRSRDVAEYIATNTSAQSGYFVVKGSPSQVSHLRQVKSFFRDLGSSYYIVAAEDTIQAEHVIGPANDRWKLPSPSYANSKQFPSSFLISLRKAMEHDTLFTGTEVEIIRRRGQEIEVLVRSRKDFEKIQRHPDVLFIKSVISAREETAAPLQDLCVNKINLAHYEFPNVDGNGLTIGVKEKSVDTADIDLRKRVVLSELADDEMSLHAGMIATIIAGAGNSRPSANGVTKSKILSTSFDNLLPDDDAVLDKYLVTVQNHSYGTEIENFYGPEAVAYDRSVVENPTRVHVFSAGNSGQQAPKQGTYSSITGVANLTGNMKMAKNVLTIGAHSRDFTIDVRNSRGPAYDGRIKPELAAYGPDGTSDAAAFVSGICAILQQKYQQNGGLPTVDVIKAVLVTTADDIGSPGVDFSTGFGSANAYKAMKLIDNGFVKTGTLSHGQLSKFQVDVPMDVAVLKVAINWIDPPAVPGSVKALTNDLDLKVSFGNNQWLPWILGSYPHIDSLTRAARRGADHLNNIEFISVDNPDPGSYEFQISGYDIQTPSQGFALTYWFESSDSFTWTYPTRADPVPASKETFFRWDSNHVGTGTLELWVNETITDSKQVDLKDGFSIVSMPEINGIAHAVMKVNNEKVGEIEFVISPELLLNVEFNCEETAMISWPVVKSADSYNVFRLGNMFMEQIATTTDTALIVSKGISPYYAIAPIFNNKPGFRSATYNITQQGVSCYYTSFLAAATPLGQGELVLDLSTKYNMKEIFWQRFEHGTFVNIGSTQYNGELNYIFHDESMKGGVTQYRAVIATKTGDLIPTEVSNVYYADDRTYAVFPNPVERQTELNILTDAQDVNIRFYDRQGQLVKVQDVHSNLFRIDVSELTPGLYLYSIQRGYSLVSSGRLIVK